MKAKRELEEARKAGTLPPEKDAEGNLINPHIPEFMAKAPWYLSQGENQGLKHQRKSAASRTSFGFDTYYKRGEFAGQATAYRKGACKNCGAMSHTEKDCTDRPRKAGAWKTGRDIRPDEYVAGDVDLDYDTKRDRYNGYNPEDHAATVSRYEAAEAERIKLRAAEKERREAEAAAAKAARRAERERLRAEKTARRQAREARRAARLAGAAGDSGAASSSAASASSGGEAAGSSGRFMPTSPPSGPAAASGSSGRGGVSAGAVTDGHESDASTASTASGRTGSSGRSADKRNGPSRSGAQPGAAGAKGSSSSSVAAAAQRKPANGAAASGGADGDSDDDDDDSSDASSVVSSGSSDSSFSASSDEAADADEARHRDEDDVRESDAAQIIGTAKTTKGGAKAKMGVRNLRLREDRAKYLINLDVDSAYYDPKTRSMREDPFAGMPGHISTTGADGGSSVEAPGGQAAAGSTYRGDLAWRRSGDYTDLVQAQMFAWDAAEKGAEVHLQANPTQLEMLRKQYAARKGALETERRDAILAQYGGAEHLQAPPKELLLGQGEAYVEYGRDGKPVLAGAAAAAAAAAAAGKTRRSRYAEDVWPGNHTSAWGSWWDGQEKAWGYACCHSSLYSSYCTGRAGRAAQKLATSFKGEEGGAPSASAAPGYSSAAAYAAAASAKVAAYASSSSAASNNSSSGGGEAAPASGYKRSYADSVGAPASGGYTHVADDGDDDEAAAVGGGRAGRRAAREEDAAGKRQAITSYGEDDDGGDGDGFGRGGGGRASQGRRGGGGKRARGGDD